MLVANPNKEKSQEHCSIF